MVRQNLSKKEKRRVKNIETTARAALRSRKPRARPATVRTRTITKIPQTISTGKAHALAYLKALKRGDPLPANVQVPCHTTIPCRRITTYWRATPATYSCDMGGSTAQNWSVVVFNPHAMLFSNGIDFQTVTCNSGVVTQSTANLPAIYEGYAATIGAHSIPTFGVAPTSSVSSSGAVDSNAVEYNSRMRFLGGRIAVNYTGNEYNSGGELFYIHNPHNTSLVDLQQSADTFAQITQNFGSAVPFLGTINNPSVALPCDPRKAHYFTIVPHSTEFEPLNTSYVTATNTAVAQSTSLASNSSTYQLDDVSDLIPVVPYATVGSPFSGTAGANTHRGWTYAIAYRSTGATAQPITITFEMEYDAQLTPRQAQPGSSTSPAGNLFATTSQTSNVNVYNSVPPVDPLSAGVLNELYAKYKYAMSRAGASMQTSKGDSNSTLGSLVSMAEKALGLGAIGGVGSYGAARAMPAILGGLESFGTSLLPALEGAAPLMLL